MTDRKRAIEKAISLAKRHFQGDALGPVCIVEGYEQPKFVSNALNYVDGQHIYPRDTHPELADVPFNIVSLRRIYQAEFDALSPFLKSEWLEANVLRRFESKLDLWLGHLYRVIEELSI